MKAERETDVQRAVLEYLRLVLGWSVWRFNCGLAVYGDRAVRFSTADGLSDLQGIIPPAGRWLSVEVKRGKGKPTAKQSAFLDAVRAAGGLAIVTNGVEDLRRQLREAGYEVP